MEDQTCNGCGVDWDDERKVLQSKWVKYETKRSPHWTCPRCLPVRFDPKCDFVMIMSCEVFFSKCQRKGFVCICLCLP